MNIINEYFKDLVFTKVVDNKEGFAIYGAGIASGLGGGKMRYVLLFVPDYLATKKQGRIHDLQWKNLQTRQLHDSYRLKTQRWSIPQNIQDFLLEVKSRTKAFSSYENHELPFEILLLHNPKKKTVFQYRNKLMLSAAIDMFDTLINYKEPSHDIYDKTTISSSSQKYNYLPSDISYNQESLINHIDPTTTLFDDSFELL